MKKVVLVLILLLGIGIFSSNFVFAVGFHNASNILINVDGVTYSLQSMIDEPGFNFYEHTYSDPTSIDLTIYELPSNICVSTNLGNSKTLLENLNDGRGILGITGTYNCDLERGHNADEIVFNDGKNLQQVMNDNGFCVDNYNDVCLDTDCYNPGKYSCNGTCKDYSYKAVKTPCNDNTGECDGAGTCSTCEANSYTSCYNGNLYYYDSCDKREGIKEDCLNDPHPSCSWGDKYCNTYNEYAKDGTCYQPGCHDGVCDSTAYSTTSTSSDACGLPVVLTDVGTIGGAAIVGATIGTAIPIPVVGTVVGAVAGAVVGVVAVVSSGSVICTELHRVGLMDDETYMMDTEFSKTHVPVEALQGYRAWGKTVVKLMRKDERILNVSDMMVKDYTDEIAYRMGKVNKSNEAGAMYLDEAMPLFERIGVLIDNPMLPEFLRANPNDKIVESYFTEKNVSDMFYEAFGNKTKPDMEFNKKYLELMAKRVEEIEAEVKSQQA